MGTPAASPPGDPSRSAPVASLASGDPIQTPVTPTPALPAPAGPPVVDGGQADMDGIECAEDDDVQLVEGQQA
eukprot:1107722-Alexandrium_andersonii.AAC.1